MRLPKLQAVRDIARAMLTAVDGRIKGVAAASTPTPTSATQLARLDSGAAGSAEVLSDTGCASRCATWRATSTSRTGSSESRASSRKPSSPSRPISTPVGTPRRKRLAQTNSAWFTAPRPCSFSSAYRLPIEIAMTPTGRLALSGRLNMAPTIWPVSACDRIRVTGS